MSPPDKQSLSYNLGTVCLLPFVGRLGSGPGLVGWIGSRVRVSVSFQPKYPPGSVLRCPTAAENGGYDREVDLPSSPAYNASSPSQTLRRPLVRTTNNGRRCECSATSAVRRGFVFHTSRLVRLTTLYTCMQRSQIFVQNRIAFFAYPTCIRRPC